MALLSLLMRPATLISGGAIGLILLTFYLGRMFKLPFLWMILIAAAILVIWLTIIIIMRIKASKAAAMLEVSLDRQAQDQLHATRPGREAEVEALRRQMNDAIEALKTSRVGKSGGRSALYVLPWYMIIGPPASGKSTLLTNSGLNFPYMDKSSKRPTVKGVGGTRNCDWWFAEQAVMLDTAGRYTLPVGADDTKEWVAFLDMLRDTRGKKPINGLMVAVSVQDLLSGNEENVEQHANKMRARIDEVIEHLGISFPIYVVFTKCDLVRGFVEFFGDLSRNERAEIWGATLPRAKVATTSASTLFTAEMDALASRLHRARIPRLSQNIQPEHRGDVLFFPLQFDALKSRLSLFIENLFKDNPYQERPIFRGFYFTSGTQEGRPIDQVINAMLSGFGMGQADEGMYVEPSQTKSYFIENVFSKVIFPDRHIAGPSAEQERKRRSRRAKLFMAGALGLVLMLVPLLWMSAVNRSLLGNVRSLGDKSQAIVQQSQQDLPLESMRTLDQFRGKLVEMERKGSPLSKALFLGTYQGDRAVEDSRNLYLMVLNDALMRPAIPTMARNLRTNSDSLRVSFDDYYEWYRSWRILLDPGDRMKPDDAPMLAKHLTRFWAPASRVTIDTEVEEYRKLIEEQLAYASKYPTEMALLYPPVPEDTDSLDDQARAALRRYWNVDLIYPALAQRTESVPEISVNSIVGADIGLVGRTSVPGTYTRAAWDGPVKEFLDDLERYRQDWAMQRAFNTDPPSLRGFMVTRYVSAYRDRWVAFLEGVAWQGSGVQKTQTFLDASGKESSPLLAVLREIAHNTAFEGDSDPNVLTLEETFTPVREFFQRPDGGYKVLRKSDGDVPLAEEYMTKVAAVAADYASIAESGNAAQSAPILALQSWIEQKLPVSEGARVPGELARVLTTPGTAVTGTAISGTRTNLSEAWQPVYREFMETLNGTFPLDPTSRKDASLADFERFFAPGGTFWAFYDANLSGIVTPDGQDKGSGVQLSDNFKGALRRAYRIQKAVFGSGAKANFRFSVRPGALQPGDAAIKSRSTQLEVGSETLLYRMGRPTWTQFAWPGPNPEAGAALRFDAGGTATIDDMTFTGAWGFFRMLEQGAVGDGGGDVEKTVEWTMNGTPANVLVGYDIRGLSANHPVSKGFFRFSLPSSLTQ